MSASGEFREKVGEERGERSMMGREVNEVVMLLVARVMWWSVDRMNWGSGMA